MAGRRGTKPRSLILAQTPGVDDPKTQRAVDVLSRAVQELQARAFGGVETVIDVFTATVDGLVPASGGDPDDVLHADGTWAPVVGGVSSVSAGSSAVTCSPTTGAVIVDVVEANFSGIPQAAVVNLVSDLSTLTTAVAAKVPNTRSLSGTAPIRIDGGASADLSANRTISITTYAGSVAGAVPPATGDGTNYLREDGTWADVSATGGDALFGTGADGALNFDGTSVVAGLTPSSGVYTLTRDIQATTVQCSGTGEIKASGYRILATTSSTAMVIRANGSSGDAAGNGGAGHPAGFLGGGTLGGSSASGPGNAHTAALPTLVPTSVTGNEGVGGGPGNNGGDGGVGTAMRGGGGGGAGNAFSNAGEGGDITRTATSAGIETVWALVQGKGEQSTTRWSYGTGGGAGAGGGGGGFGGGGGGGAGAVVHCAPTITGGTFEAKGGNAGAAQVGGAGGGGGGGGGGLVCLVYRVRVGGTVTVTGGVGTVGGVAATTGGRGGDGGDGVGVNVHIIGSTGSGGGSGTLVDGDYGDITVSGSGSTMTVDAGVITTTKLGGDITTAGKALLDDANAAAQRTTLGLGTLATASTIATADITNDAVTYAKMQNVSATSRLLGRITAGAGDTEELTGTQATSLLDLATTSVKGLAPVLPNDATKFLDGTGVYSVPAGSGSGGAAAFSGCAVYKAAAQNVSSVTNTLLTFDSEAFDTDGYHSTSSNTSRLIAPAAGYYQVNMTYAWSANGTGVRLIQIRKNAAGAIGSGTDVLTTDVVTLNASYGTIHQASTIILLAAGDYLETFAYQDSGSTLTVTTTATYCFSLVKIGGVAGTVPVGASAYNSTNQTLTSATGALITFNSEHYDTSSIHSTSSNTGRLTAPVAGYYLISYVGEFASNATGFRQILIAKNAAGVYGAGTSLAAARSTGVGSDAPIVQVTHTVLLAAGDYVEAFAYQNSGGNLALTGDFILPFQMTLLSGTPQPAFSGASVYASASQNITSGSWQAITYNTEDYDTDGYHSTVSNTSRLTATATGYYHVSGTLNFTTNSTGLRYLRFFKNGTTEYMRMPMVPTGSSELTVLQISMTLLLNVGDYIELMAFQGSGSTLACTADSSMPFQIARLGT